MPLRFSCNISLLFTELKVLDRFYAAARAGFQAVEMQWPYELKASDLARGAESAGLKFALINLPAGDLPSGGQGLAAAPNRTTEFHDAVQLGLEYATRLQCRSVNLLAGRLLTGDSRAKHLATYVENVQYAAEVFSPAGIQTCIEAINLHDMHGSLISTQDTALDVLDRVDNPNTALQFDAYHVSMMGERPTRRFNAIADRIGHIQFADMPGRHQPGTGTTDFPSLFAAIEHSSYDGWTGAEYRPAGRTTDSLDWMRDSYVR